MKYTKISLLCLSFLLSNLFFSATSYAVLPKLNSECTQSLLKFPEGSYRYYIERSQARRSGEGAGKTPKFLNPKEEVEIAKTWKGEDFPRMLSEMLPPNFKAINHSLKSSEEGMVKSSTYGVGVSLRYEEGDYATNVVVSLKDIMANVLDQKGKLQGGIGEKFVSPDAKAAIFWVHGGGTTETSSQVALGPMNALSNYGYSVIAADMDGHGEGRRIFLEDPDAYWDIIVDYVEKYVPDNVPVYIAGHSYGGYVANRLWRLSDKPKYKRISGFIELSGVADSAPGGSVEDKVMAEREIESRRPEYEDRISEADKNVTIDMVRERKISPYSGHAVGSAMRSHDWSIPEHKGKNWKPLLSVMGECDGLCYVGREHIWEKYNFSLENVESHVIPASVGFGGPEKVDIGHLIFEWYLEGTETLGTFQLIKEFIAKHEGHEVAPVKKVASEVSGVLGKFLQAYANNLAFREWVHSYKVTQVSLTEQGLMLTKLSGPINRYLKIREKFLKKARTEAMANRMPFGPEEEKEALKDFPEPLPDGVKSYDDAVKLKEFVSLMHSQEIVPDGPKSGFAKVNIAERRAIVEQVKILNKKRELLSKEQENLKGKRDVTSTKLGRLMRELDENGHPMLDGLRDKPDSILMRLMDYDKKIREGLEDYRDRLIAEDRLTPENEMNYPKEVQDIIDEYAELSNYYDQALAVFRSQAIQMGLAGQFGEEIKTTMVELFGEKGGYLEPGEGGFERQLIEAGRELAEVQGNLFALQKERDRLLKLYIDEIFYDYYSVKEYRLISSEKLPGILDQPLEDWEEFRKILEDAWLKWERGFYSARPPAGIGFPFK